VVFFFLITGFLFWTKVLKAGGRIDPIDPYRNRFLRITPMYVASVFAVMGVVFTFYRFRLLTSPAQLLIDAGRLIGLGLIPWGSFNGANPGLVNFFVVWTLRAEWLFYLALPILAIFCRPGRLAALSIPVILFGQSRETPDPKADYFAPVLAFVFLCGMVAAQSLELFGPRKALAGRCAAIGCLACLGIVPLLVDSPYEPQSIVAAAVVFYCFVNGNTMFGVLSGRAARFLGTISYSVYLIHGIAIYVTLRIVGRFVDFATLPLPLYWLMLWVCGLGLIGVCALTYRYVEHPAIEWDRKIKLARSRPQRAPKPVPIIAIP
jgi:peptidoglycan/LPS O-acetylase OafA/YrhL